MELKYKISESFPEIERIDIKVIDDNGWPWNRFKEFSYNSSSETAFHLECPRPKCLGHTRGIYFKSAIEEMVANHESHRQQRFTCMGYGWYNLTFHCDWYAVLDISIKYHCV